MPSEGNTPLAWEYAKCKNRGGDSRSQYHLYAGALNCAGGFRGRKLAMTDDPSRPATAAPRTERKQLTPAAKRALAEAAARRQAAEARGRQQSRGGKRQACGKGVSGSEGPGTDPLWRLGKQGHRLRFLSLGIALADFSTLRAEADGFKQKAARLHCFLHFQILQQPISATPLRWRRRRRARKGR